MESQGTLILAASAKCNAEHPEPESWSGRSLDADSYQQIIDVRDCIIAEGVDYIAQPPSLDNWLEQAKNIEQMPWTPYGWLAEFESVEENPKIGREKWLGLMEGSANNNPSP